MRAVMNGVVDTASSPSLNIIELILATYNNTQKKNGVGELILTDEALDPNLESPEISVLEEALMTRTLRHMKFTDQDYRSFHSLQLQMTTHRPTQESETDSDIPTIS